MSSTLNVEVLPKIPPLVDELLSVANTELGKVSTDVAELAKQSGAPQFIEDAKMVETVNNAFKDMLVKCMGDASDTVGSEGTVMSAYNAGKRLEKAMGGAM